MFKATRRYLLIIALLLAGVVLTWRERLTSAGSFSQQEWSQADVGEGSDREAPAYVYFVDVEGWYRITPHETVVGSQIDLTADSTETLAAALPAILGEWQQRGPDEFIGNDPAVVFYLKQPTVALQRTYEDPLGQQVTLAIIGNKGEDSFLLFSHTPETCYPGRQWTVVESGQETALLDDRPMYAQYLLTKHAETGQELLVLFWYLWDNPQRDSKDGVLSMRVNVLIGSEQTREEALARAWGLVRALFPATIPWSRF